MFAPITFQSHYGLILSEICILHEKISKPIFQSHYGLILSFSSKLSVVCWIRTFNPTMVWFYRRPRWRSYKRKSGLSIPLWSDFISTVIIILSPQILPFQSHYGLILSHVFTNTNLHIQLPFNPTMVWFYLKRLKTIYLFRIYGFQSHYGLILSYVNNTFHRLWCSNQSFNPTMVWFYLA